MNATATHQPATISETITETADRRLFTTDKYERMIAAGILTEDEHLELLDGEIVRMSPIGAHHAYAVRTLTNLLVKQVGHIAIVDVQNPIRFSDSSMPIPDIAVLHQ